MSEQPYELLIKNGDVVLADGVRRADVAVEGERIAAIDAKITGAARRVIDARGKFVFPGFIDPHTHMGIPIKNTTSADDFESGSIAAAFGGVTTILDFTVQERGQTLREAIDVRRQNANGQSHVDYGIHVNVTDQPLQHLQQIPALIREGYTSFKTFSTYREAGMMITWDEFRHVMRAVNEHGGFIMLHAEDNELIETYTAQYLSGDRVDAICHARSRPAEAEAKAIRDAAQIAGELGAALYIVHLSSKAGLEAGLAARRAGVNIYLETCPQYLVLTEEKYLGENGHCYIATPALRTQADADALWQAVADGDIDTIGTDHCPFTLEQKNHHKGVFHLTPNGLPGVETMFPLLYTYGVTTGRLNMEQLVQLLAGNAARIFGIDERKGSLRVGADADIVIWDPAAESVVEAPALHGKADWSPFEGLHIAGQLAYTILRGHLLVENGTFVGEHVYGELLRAKPLENGTHAAREQEPTQVPSSSD